MVWFSFCFLCSHLQSFSRFDISILLLPQNYADICYTPVEAEQQGETQLPTRQKN